ncbi:hypothetical protein [Acinetobacter gerneri]|uniref:hypothetical protein n=1 Tax=Acinetobacter gerneri TaxID=202952 RepID=UPI0028A6A7EF|nr:hypothetical protein [Acinetobacter gerneri]
MNEEKLKIIKERYNDFELIGATIDDQDFIAYARQDIPNLLNEIDRLQKLLQE